LPLVYDYRKDRVIKKRGKRKPKPLEEDSKQKKLSEWKDDCN